MKRIVFALAIFVVFSNFVFADNAKKINSFCGIKFGSTPLKKHSFISRTKSGSRLYNFKPQKYFMNFKECGYAATPFTNKIAMVFLICRVKTFP